jgi:hypothetical protein
VRVLRRTWRAARLSTIRAYLSALDGIRDGAGAARSPLDPSWGERELYVNLAYSYLNRPSPDLALAQQYVDRAIRLVPGWRGPEGRE